MTISHLLLSLATWSVASCLVLAVAWVATKLIRGNAAMRHLVWLFAFVALATMPIFGALIPGRALPAPNEEVYVVDLDPALVSDLQIEDTTPAPTLFDWTPVLSGVAIAWAIGSLGIGLRAANGIWQTKKMRANATPRTPEEWGLEIPSNLVTREWELCSSRSNRPPAAMTWGSVRPVVMMPLAVDDWEPECTAAVLKHELAHVARYDSLSQVFALAVCAFYWFNPLVWLAAKAMRAEAEMAADDRVIQSGVKPSDYATELLKLATELGAKRQPLTFVGVSVMKHSHIETRLRSALDPNNRRRGVARREALVAAATTFALALAIVSVRPAMAQDKPTLPSAPVVQGAPPAVTVPGQPLPATAPQGTAPAISVPGRPLPATAAKATRVKGVKAKKAPRGKSVKGRLGAATAPPVLAQGQPVRTSVPGVMPGGYAPSAQTGVSAPGGTAPAIVPGMSAARSGVSAPAVVPGGETVRGRSMPSVAPAAPLAKGTPGVATPAVLSPAGQGDKTSNGKVTKSSEVKYITLLPMKTYAVTLSNVQSKMVTKPYSVTLTNVQGKKTIKPYSVRLTKSQKYSVPSRVQYITLEKPISPTTVVQYTTKVGLKPTTTVRYVPTATTKAGTTTNTAPSNKSESWQDKSDQRKKEADEHAEAARKRADQDRRDVEIQVAQARDERSKADQDRRDVELQLAKAKAERDQVLNEKRQVELQLAKILSDRARAAKSKRLTKTSKAATAKAKKQAELEMEKARRIMERDYDLAKKNRDAELHQRAMAEAEKKQAEKNRADAEAARKKKDGGG